MLPKGHYTGIGSRKTPEPILELMVDLGYALHQQGWILRSGGADGADRAFQDGATAHPFSDFIPREIYLPWNHFNGLSHQVENGIYDTTLFKNRHFAQQAIQPLIPYWDQLKSTHQNLYIRNAYQVLGYSLKRPTQLVICWAPPTKDGGVEGGTGVAVRLAQKHNIPIINLYYEAEVERAKNTIRKAGTPKSFELPEYDQTSIQEFYKIVRT